MYHQPSPPAATLLEQIRRDNPKRSFTRNRQGTAIGMWADGRWNTIAGWGIHGRWMRIGDLLVDGKPVTPQDDWIPVDDPQEKEEPDAEQQEELDAVQTGTAFPRYALRDGSGEHENCSMYHVLLVESPDHVDEDEATPPAEVDVRSLAVVVEGNALPTVAEMEYHLRQQYPDYTVTQIRRLDTFTDFYRLVPRQSSVSANRSPE